MSINKVTNCYNVFNQLVFNKQAQVHKLTDTDKILLNKLLDNVKDNTI